MPDWVTNPVPARPSSSVDELDCMPAQAHHAVDF
jgi:hypothetical protein